MGGLGLRLSLLMLMALLPLGLLSLAQTRSTLVQAEEGQRLAAMSASLRSAAPYLQHIRNAQSTVEFLSHITETLINNPQQCTTTLRDLAQAHREWTTLSFVTPDGVIACNSAIGPTDFSADEVVQRIIQTNRPQVVNELAYRDKQSSALVISHPAMIKDVKAGHFVVVLPHAVKSLPDEGVALFPGLKEMIATTTIDQNGTVITSSLPLEQAKAALPAPMAMEELRKGVEHSFFADAADGKHRLFTTFPLTGGINVVGTWQYERASIESNWGLNPFVAPILMWLVGVAMAVYSAERLVGRHLRKLSSAMRSFTFGKRELRDLKLDDPPQEIAYLANAYRSMIETILRDETQLENLIRQKEELLREVHHRTGNSLQLIASIMRMHRRETNDPKIHAILDNLSDRVMNLSTVHLGLYRISGLAEVPVDQLLGEVIGKVDAMLVRKGKSGRIETHMPPILIKAQQAVPLALLLAEVLANAQLEEVTDPITIALETHGEHQARLTLHLPLAMHDLLLGHREGAAALISSRLIRSFVQQLEGEMTLYETSAEPSMANARTMPATLMMNVSFKIRQ